MHKRKTQREKSARAEEQNNIHIIYSSAMLLFAGFHAIKYLI
jgi:hypothetical protein